MTGEQIKEVCEERETKNCKDCPAKDACRRWRHQASISEPWELKLLVDGKDY